MSNFTFVGYLESNGRFIVVSERTGEEVLTIRLAVHLKDWAWRELLTADPTKARAALQQKGVGDLEHPPGLASSDSFGLVRGNDGDIYTHTRVTASSIASSADSSSHSTDISSSFSDYHSALDFVVTSSPALAEMGVSRMCPQISLPAARFAHGTFSGQSNFKLVSPDSQPADDCHPFQHVSRFEGGALRFRSADQHLDFELFIEQYDISQSNETPFSSSSFLSTSSSSSSSSTSSTSSFLSSSTSLVVSDSRKWGPFFDIRIQETSQLPLWDAPLRWRFSLRPAGRCRLRLGCPGAAPALTPEVRASLHGKGFYVFPDLVPRPMVEAALSLINAQMGQHGAGRWEDIANSPILTQLYLRTGARRLVEEIVGPEDVPEWSGKHVQVALIFPSREAELQPLRRRGHHIDGIPTEGNKLEKGRLHPFTLLVGVYLSDVSQPHAGNLFLYPGSHLQHAAHWREDPARIPRMLEQDAFEMPRVELAEPEQVQGGPGTVVIANYLTGHGIAQNASPHIRYAVYFRISSRKLLERRKDDLQNYENYYSPWMDCQMFHDKS